MLGSVGLGLGSVGTAAGQGAGAGGDSADDTLAKIWAFGAGDNPLVDNVFNMPSGNMRFVGTSGAGGGLPASGFFESSTASGDPRIGTDYFARFYRLGAHIGGMVFDQFDGYDPTWDGTFRGMDGIQHIVAQAGFSNGSSPQTGPTPGLVVGREVFWNIFGFGDGPDYYPVVGFNNGAREDIRWDLYNEFDNAMFERGRLTGYGTWVGRPDVIQHGTTAAFDTQGQFLTVGGISPGDGIGWFVRNNTGDPPLGILRWFTVDGNVAGGVSGWELLGSNGAGTLTSLLKMDTTNGAVWGVPVSSIGGGQVAGMFKSAVVDFKTPATIPVIPPIGYRIATLAGMFAEVKTATAATVAPTLQGGTDAGASNIVASQTPAAIVTQPIETRVTIPLLTPLVLGDLSANGFNMKITVGATATALTGRFYLLAGLMPI